MIFGRRRYIDRAAQQAIAAARAAESLPVIASGRALEAQGKLDEALAGIETGIAEGVAKGEPCKELRAEKIRLLRRMDRPQDAIAAAFELMSTCYQDEYRLIYEIYLQFGMFDEAAEHIGVWKKARKKPWEDEEFTVENRNLMWARVHQETIQQNFAKASVSLFDKFTEIGGTDVANENIVIQSTHGIWLAERKLRARQLKDALWEPNNHERLMRAYANVAINGWHMGNAIAMAENAKKSLNEYELLQAESSAGSASTPGAAASVGSASGALPNDRMLVALKSLMLALLGRMDEAREQQELQRTLAPCSFCVYRACKATALLEARLAAVEENWPRAIELCEAGLTAWPDETAFMVERGFASSRMPKAVED